MKKPTHSFNRRRFLRQRGLSLVEVMISVVIGLVVTGAVIVTYLATSRSNKLQMAFSEMNENAQLGMGLITRDLLLAGYSAPNAAAGTVTTGVGVNAVTTINRNYSGRAVFGCDQGFASVNSTVAATCAASGTSPSIEVSYEADITNSVPTSANVPSDCLGNGLALNGTYYLAMNRYYVANSATGRPELHCASNQGSVGQPIVENVEAMQFWYGEATAAAPRAVARYVSAANVTDWSRIVSVRVCMVMRSSEPVLSAEDTLTYLNCSSTSTNITDRLARRAYFTTVTLRNKMAF